MIVVRQRGDEDDRRRYPARIDSIAGTHLEMPARPNFRKERREVRLEVGHRGAVPLEPVTVADNDAVIRAIEKQLHCTCGCNLDVYTCRTTDFTCTVSPAMHQHVVGLAERGMTGQQIIDQFVREHGVAILMAPPKRGFNLAGYFVPSVLIVAAGLVLTLVLRRWTRTATTDPVPAQPVAPAGTSEELERLRGELDRLSV